MSLVALRPSFRTVLAAAALAGIALVTAAPSHAHAETAAQRNRTYFQAMDGLTASIDAWNADVVTGIAAAQTKPEFVCSADFAELVRRGHGLANDFEGTGLIAPTAVAGNHDGAAQGLRQQYEGLAAMAVDCSYGATGTGPGTEIATGQAAYAKAVRLIRYYTARYR